MSTAIRIIHKLI